MAHPGAVMAHPGAMEAHTGAVEAFLFKLGSYVEL
jgi:hypothetical protein